MSRQLMHEGAARQAWHTAVEPVPAQGYTHISVARRLPQVLLEFGVDPGDALEAAGLRRDHFDDLHNTIDYAPFQRLLAACVQLTGCDHIALLISRHTRLVDFGIVGQHALCAVTAGEGLRNLIQNYNLHSTATTTNLLEEGGFSRFVYAISIGGCVDTAQFHTGAAAVLFNILKDLFGPQWLPVAVTFATDAPADLRAFHRHFGAPLRFNSEATAVIFESYWLDRPLPVVDAEWRRQVAAAIGSRQVAMRADLPATVRRILRKQMLIGPGSMNQVAASLGMHRRTLDRKLQEHGVRYGELLESVKADIALQLLRDTQMQVQQVAEALHFSSAANFATAFQRWTGMTPTTYRRRG